MKRIGIISLDRMGLVSDIFKGIAPPLRLCDALKNSSGIFQVQLLSK